jgi:predicted Zn finger-like uncharacterized protein
MICPNCQTELHEVKAETGLGYYLALDQCGDCGGIWCDRWEALPLTPAAAERLDPVDEAALALNVPAATPTPCCPRCRARLRLVSDRLLPSDARVARCPNCEGLWFNRGELRAFKRRAGARRRAAAALERLTQRVMDAGTPAPTVRRLADAAEPVPQGEAAAGLVRETVGGLWWVVLRTALRFLLHI